MDAVDVSATAIAHAANAAIARRVRVNWQCRDLLAARDPVPVSTYALIVMFRFVAPKLLPSLLFGLTPGGVLIVEEHLQWAGPERNFWAIEPTFSRDSKRVINAIDGGWCGI